MILIEKNLNEQQFQNSLLKNSQPVMSLFKFEKRNKLPTITYNQLNV